MPVPDVVRQLVERYDEHKDSYRSPRYNEAQLRQEFLNPFFEALGWDVANKKGYAVQYREVIHEDSIRVRGSQNAKAPDYAFRLGGVRKFFVEAKKPAEDIENTKEFAYQLKVYAWNLGLPLSILTDFEGFAVYDCRTRPNRTDSPAAGRVMFVKYDQYLERWDEIAGIFSPDAIRKGAFDQYAEDNTAKKGTIKVDDSFLQEIESWRTLLARNIALRNDQVTNERQLNFAVQMTISRIIFLRICEDRGIEPQNQLLELSKGREIYPGLVALYLKADQKYNSGLFHFKAEAGNHIRVDAFTPGLSIDDRVLKTIIKSLYYPSPYVFKEIPVEILGQVYERFLGKVIRLTPSGQAKVEEKPEVRKAGGVYYTPKYIVDYIVENTVGKLLEGKTPEEAAELKIVDPACGSGSFLLGAFQHLLDWHEQWYLAHDPETFTKGKQPALLHTAEGEWRLTTEEKKRILLNNIYGVDIDAQAVEVTKLSLLLKVLEEETGQLTLGFERALPDLGDNIKCGNSLIGWDYFEGQLIRDEAEVARVNPFDWEQGFPGLFANGGFDAVIGNPPWAFTKYVNWGENVKEYIDNVYLIGNKDEEKNLARQSGKINLFAIFLLKGIYLLKKDGLFSYIIPNNILRTTVYDTIRKEILSKFDIEQIVNLQDGVFDRVTASTIILIVRNKLPKKESLIQIIENKDMDSINDYEVSFINQLACLNNTSYVIDIFTSPEIQLIFQNLKRNTKALSEFLDVYNGIATNKNMAGILKEKIDKNSKPILFGKDISRYAYSWSGKYVNYVRSQLLRARNEDIFLIKEKLIMQRIGGILITAYDNKQFYTFNSVNNLIVKSNLDYSLKYFLGLLNSSLLKFYFITKFTNKSKLTVNITKTFLDELPIRTLDFHNTKDVFKHNKMVTLVEHMIHLHKQNPQTPNDKQRLESEIKNTDSQIDRLVYDLYGLTDEEIRIVEG